MESGKINYSLRVMSKEELTYEAKLKEDNIYPVMAKLYALRGMKDFNDVNLIKKLEPWENMKNIEKAAKMLCQAIVQGQKICIVADYDVDGATACTIALRGLKMFGAKIDYIVPNRFVHGYGLTPSVVAEAINKKNPDLIITVDNGISSHEGVNFAHSKGVKVLVTDHHLAGETLPNADCIVNPNQPDCQFKNKSIAGCGVMFYVLCAVRKHFVDLGVYSSETVPNVFSLLDLVAIGTIADVVKLDPNNRIMVRIGLNYIRRKLTRPGVLALINVAKRKVQDLTTMDIAFGLAPRVNAAGRLEDMSIGIQTLMTENHDKAHELSLQLNEINQKRKGLESDMKEEAMELPKLKGESYSKIAFAESFHEGVIGIVASRIKEQFYRPTIVFAPAQEEGLIKGSGRSIPEIHLRDALDYVHKKNPTIIVKFGGHAMAAGLTIEKEKLDLFSDLFEEAVKYYCNGKELKNQKDIDIDLETKYINIETADLIKDEIWGQGFPAPLFSGKFNLVDQKILKDAHLKVTLERDNIQYEGMWFFKSDLLDKGTHNFVYSLGINDFRDKKTVQIMIEGIN